MISKLSFLLVTGRFSEIQFNLIKAVFESYFVKNYIFLTTQFINR